ncbi:gonadotropin-releasing hormone receptor [Phlebotomus argentipes]|uniref:gonadotropin-releasing hormone receptor n=1 Tax=Phlebotomus argentipes TaxID=94469 RepID=UPI0028930026|nr:gonadotropin-releasing hormone receptor [Phlebotomus argentipes]
MLQESVFFPEDDPGPNATIALESAPQFSSSSLVKFLVLSAMGVVAIVGNLATIWSIRKSRALRRAALHNCTSIYHLITHLSIADLLVSCFCIVGEAAWSYTVQWRSTDFMCRSVKYFQMFSLYLSTYVLLLIGIDRWMAVKHPMKSFHLDIRWRIVSVYIISLIFSLPQFFIFSVQRGPFVEDFHQCVTHGAYDAFWQEQLYTTLTLVLMFVIPLVILVGTYLASFREISQNEQLFTSAPNTVLNASLYKRQKMLHRAKMKSFRMSVIIILAFLICWTPYYAMMLIFIFLNPDEKLEEDLQSAIFFFGMSNSLVNPLIYGFFHVLPRRRRLRRSIPPSEPTILRDGDRNSQRKFSLSSLFKFQS